MLAVVWRFGTQLAGQPFLPLPQARGTRAIRVPFFCTRVRTTKAHDGPAAEGSRRWGGLGAEFNKAEALGLIHVYEQLVRQCGKQLYTKIKKCIRFFYTKYCLEK